MNYKSLKLGDVFNLGDERRSHFLSATPSGPWYQVPWAAQYEGARYTHDNFTAHEYRRPIPEPLMSKPTLETVSVTAKPNIASHLTALRTQRQIYGNAIIGFLVSSGMSQEEAIATFGKLEAEEINSYQFQLRPAPRTVQFIKESS